MPLMSDVIVALPAVVTTSWMDAHFARADSNDHQKPIGNTLIALFFKDSDKKLESLVNKSVKNIFQHAVFSVLLNLTMLVEVR